MPLNTGRIFTFPFNLENGGAQLATHFAHIAQYHYNNTLMVTETEPLVMYMLSMFHQSSSVEEEKRAAMSKFIQDYIAQHGAVTLTNHAGLFEAW